MKTNSSKPALFSFEDMWADLDLCRWTGAGLSGFSGSHPRAARTAELQEIRDRKLYSDVAQTWEEFCDEYLGVDRRSVDRAIRQLRDFGPAFFHANDAWPVSTRQYRGIQTHIRADGVMFEGVLVPFGERNRRQVAAALDQLLRRAHRPARMSRTAYPGVVKRLEVAARRLEAVYITLDRLEKIELSALLGRLVRRAFELGVRAT
jgi:hypothetical protein